MKVSSLGFGVSFSPFPLLVTVALSLGVAGCGLVEKQLEEGDVVHSVPPDSQDWEQLPDGSRVTRISRPPDTFSTRLSQRFEKILGKDFSAPAYDHSVDLSADELGGSWVLLDDAGVQICRLTLLVGASRDVIYDPDCTGVMERVVSWGLFGRELYLRDQSSVILVRLQVKGDKERLRGFVVDDGSLVEMTRGE